MKLPDFSVFEPLVRVREMMGADEDGQVQAIPWERLRLEGVEIPLHSVVADPEETLTWNGARVLLYIRDKYSSNARPKYHVSECSTLRQMRVQGRIERYVVTNRTDGVFVVKVVDKHTGRVLRKDVQERLAVCHNCLRQLDWDGYRSARNTDAVVRAFSPAAFFKVYTNHWSPPVATTSPGRGRLGRPLQKKTKGDAMPPWAKDIVHQGHLQVLLHLERHRPVTEEEVTRMLGGPRHHRRFARRVAELESLVPFRISVRTLGGVKHYLRE